MRVLVAAAAVASSIMAAVAIIIPGVIAHPQQQAQEPMIASDPPRIVALGDLHGDLAKSLRVLRMARVIDDANEWIAAPNTILVQTGDIVDRGDDTIALYDLLRNLTVQAELAGGRVVRVLGNHEVMNMADDWRYVWPADIASFGGEAKRREAFSARGQIGSELRALDLLTRVGNTVFMHGGCTPKWAALGIDGINALGRAAMKKGQWHHDTFGGDGVLWYRGYAQDAETRACPLLYKALDKLGVERMVMGHTPQLSGKILSRCDGRAIIIDVGISSYYGGNCAALEIIGDRVKALYCDSDAVDISSKRRIEIKE